MNEELRASKLKNASLPGRIDMPTIWYSTWLISQRQLRSQ